MNEERNQIQALNYMKRQAIALEQIAEILERMRLEA
jgi:hypothetical protein